MRCWFSWKALRIHAIVDRDIVFSPFLTWYLFTSPSSSSSHIQSVSQKALRLANELLVCMRMCVVRIGAIIFTPTHSFAYLARIWLCSAFAQDIRRQMFAMSHEFFLSEQSLKRRMVRAKECRLLDGKLRKNQFLCPLSPRQSNGKECTSEYKPRHKIVQSSLQVKIQKGWGCENEKK